MQTSVTCREGRDLAKFKIPCPVEKVCQFKEAALKTGAPCVIGSTHGEVLFISVPVYKFVAVDVFREHDVDMPVVEMELKRFELP